MTGMIEVEGYGSDGAIPCYRADPAAPSRAAVIVVQEIFGLNPGIRAKADRWAELGYLALAPEMFWRFAPGFVADPDIEDQARAAFTIRAQFDADAGVRDIEACIRFARRETGGGKAGVVGFCMGGRMAYLAATRTDCDASVGYYGARIDQALDEAHAIARPLMLHFAEQDHFIDADARGRIHAALANNRHVTIHDYAGVDHGFAATGGSRRSDGAARLADARTEAFFAEYLA
jgi:carboxymethylenebutenolidase